MTFVRCVNATQQHCGWQCNFWIDAVFASSDGSGLAIHRLDRYVDCTRTRIEGLSFRDLVATLRAVGHVPVAVRREQ